MKILRKLSVGSANGIRGGFRDVHEGFRALTVIGIARGYKEKTSETMGVSYAFQGEFSGINMHGEECRAAIAFFPEPVQSMLKEQIDSFETAPNVEFGFEIHVVPDETSVKGYVFETKTLKEVRPSNALGELMKQLGVEAPQGALQLDHDAEEENVKVAPAKGKTTANTATKRR